MKPMTSIAALSALTILLAACATSGSAGTVPPGGATPEPSVAQGSPDLTPEPSSPSVGVAAPAVDRPVGLGVPRVRPLRPRGRPSSGRTSIYESVPDSSGLVPILREVPETKAVATAAMTALLERADRVREQGHELGDSGGDEAARPHDQGRGCDRRPVERVRVRRRQRVRPHPPRPGRLHADPVPDGEVGRLPDRGSDRDRLRQPGHRPRRPGRPGRLRRISCPRSSSTGRPTARRSATPARVTGSAQAIFEATFRVTLLDGGGRTIADQQVMAACMCGSGALRCDRRYDVPKAQWGTLRVWAGSAKDGSPSAVREYPGLADPRLTAGPPATAGTPCNSVHARPSRTREGRRAVRRA